MTNSNSSGEGAAPEQALDPATRTFTTDRFTLHGDRREKPFVMLRSGLSHGGGHIQYILSIDEARELANELLRAAAFAAMPTLGARISSHAKAEGR